MTQNVELDISTMEMTIDGEKVTGKCRSEPNYGLNEDLDDRSIRVGMYFHYNLSKSADAALVLLSLFRDLESLSFHRPYSLYRSYHPQSSVSYHSSTAILLMQLSCCLISVVCS